MADALAGKAIKCPKCTTVVLVPPAAPAPEQVEELEEVDGDAPDALEEVDERSRRREKDPGPDLDLEHDVPEPFQDRIAAELARGERLVWVGQPLRPLMWVRSLKGVCFGLFFLALMGFIWFGVAFPELLGKKRAFDQAGASCLMAVVFLFVLACVALWPFWFMFRAGRTCYALTSRRAVVWSCEWHGGVKVTTYTPAELTRMRRADSWAYGRGAGDLIFRSRTVVAASTRGVSSRTYHYGFLGIAKVRAVEKLVRKTLVDRLNG